MQRCGSPAAGGAPPLRQQQRSFPMPGERRELRVVVAHGRGRAPGASTSNPARPLPSRCSPDHAIHAAHSPCALGCVGPKARRHSRRRHRRRLPLPPLITPCLPPPQVPQRALRRAALQRVRAEEQQSQPGAELENPESEAARKKAEADRLRAAEKFMTVRGALH